MESENDNLAHRRDFLQAGAVATTSTLILAGAGSATAGQDVPTREIVLPRRPLGKTGAEITLLDIGTGRGKGIDRLLRFAYAKGIRVYDTSETYGSEAELKRWFAANPAVRKNIFVVSKDSPKTPDQLPAMLDKRCDALGTEYIDLIFMHSFGDYFPVADAVAMLKSRDLAKTVEAIKKSGKARFVGISTHHKDRAVILEAAAEGGLSMPSWYSTTPGSRRNRPSTGHSTPAGRKALASSR